jgi:hypothetical protein
MPESDWVPNKAHPAELDTPRWRNGCNRIRRPTAKGKKTLLATGHIPSASARPQEPPPAPEDRQIAEDRHFFVDGGLRVKWRPSAARSSRLPKLQFYRR